MGRKVFIGHLPVVACSASAQLYRYIRHPSYAGMLLYIAGYVLVFRCWLGLLLVAATLALLLARMNAEEALLQNEFGEDYASYRHHTWRLVPWVYCASRSLAMLAP
jgi:protein-S-isoprenylcysteine O-methyltransferase Ste14